MSYNLSIALNKDGLSIPYLQEKVLCSFRNPVNEAKTWSEIYSKFLTDVNIILGAGAGYHVLEIANQFPQHNFFVIDFAKELKYFFYQNNKNIPSNIAFILPDHANDIFEDKIIQLLMGTPIQVLPFKPAWDYNRLEFDKLYANLTGRSQLGLNFALQFGKTSFSLVQSGSELVHMKDVISHSDRNDPILNCLGELYK